MRGRTSDDGSAETTAGKPAQRNSVPEPTAWSAGTRIAFRFTFVAVLLFSILRLVPDLLGRLPVPLRAGVLWSDAVAQAWNAILRWPRALILTAPGNPGRWPFTGIGPNILIDLFSMLVLAGVLAVAWSYLDRRRGEYRVLHESLRIYLRFSLAVLLMHYGLFKVLLNQGDFPPLPSRMLMPWGMFQPQEIPITMMGAAPLYQIFAGAVELLGGVLLVFRRTARVGALVALAAAANVAALNIGYQMTGMAVLSISMLVMSFILIVPDVSRLFAVLVLDLASPARAARPLFENLRLRRAAQVCGLIFFVGEAAYILHDQLTTGAHWRDRPPLYGAYDVETFVRGGDTIPPLLTDTTRWMRFAVDPSSDPLMRTGNAYAYIMFAQRIRPIALRVDAARQTMTVIPFGSPRQTSEWAYSVPDEEHVVLMAGDGLRTGDGPADSLRVTLRRVDLGSMPLLQPRRSLR